VKARATDGERSTNGCGIFSSVSPPRETRYANDFLDAADCCFDAADAFFFPAFPHVTVSARTCGMSTESYSVAAGATQGLPLVFTSS
jgi:hypothetical protein